MHDQLPVIPPQKRKIPADDRLYIVDNGAILCGKHLGMSAAWTGRDISGQKIERLTHAEAIQLVREGFAPACEDCGTTMGTN